MKLIVLTSSRNRKNEPMLLTQFFDMGLETLHLSKPKYTKKQYRQLLNKIPQKYHRHIVLNQHHSLAISYDVKGIHFSSKKLRKKLLSKWTIWKLKWIKPKLLISRSFNNLSDLINESYNFDYAILSPVFEGISKKTLSSGFSPNSIKSSINRSKLKIYALGGVQPKNFEDLVAMGFVGGAVMGYIWSEKNKLERLKVAIDKCVHINSGPDVKMSA